MLSRAGRELGVQLLLDTQRPEKLNPSLIGSATELICFKLIHPQGLKAVKGLGADPERSKSFQWGASLPGISFQAGN